MKAGWSHHLKRVVVVLVGITTTAPLTVPEDWSGAYSVVLSAVPTWNATATVSMPTGSGPDHRRDPPDLFHRKLEYPQEVRVIADADNDSTSNTDRGGNRPHLQSGYVRSRGPTYPIV